MHVIEAKGLDASDRHVRNAIAYKLALRTSRRINLDSVSGLPDVAARHSVAQSRMFTATTGAGARAMIRMERDPALPPGTAEALDSDGNVLATITLPHERVPSGTATVRLGGDVFDGMIKTLDDIKGD